MNTHFSSQSSVNATSLATIRDAVRAYLRLGWRCIPVRRGGKRPADSGWPDLRLEEHDVERFFPAGGNVGILCGEASGRLVDVDCDVPEAAEAAAELLPATGRIHGRPGNPSSHWWYVTSRPISTLKSQFTEHNADKPTMLVELRSSGCFTVVPPSVYHGDAYGPGGEQLRWEREGEPAHVDPDDLQRAVARIAACALLARHWPGRGSRDEAAMALCGMLLRSGWAVEDTDQFVTLTARIAGDEEWTERAKAIRTQQRLARDQMITGARALVERLRDGERVVAKAREWLGLRSSDEQIDRADREISELSEISQAFRKVQRSVGAHYRPERLAEDAYHGLAGAIVAAIEPHTEADPVALLLQFLCAFGNIAGRRAFFIAEGQRHHPNLFVTLVGDTAKARKGSSWAQAIRLFRGVAESWLTEHVTSGLSSGEGLIHALRDVSTEDDADDGRVKQRKVQTTTALHLDKRLLVREGEFASVLKAFAREGNTLSATLRQAWDGDDLGVLTKNAPERASQAHVSLVGHITSEELRRYLSQTEAANGLGNRFLWLCVRRSKLLPDGGALEEVDLEPLRQWLRDVVAFVEGLDDRQMTRDPEARRLWHEVYTRLSKGYPGLFGALTARAEAQVMRLASIYALLDCSVIIHIEHLRAALAIWDYAEASVRAIFGDALGDPTADTIFRALRTAPNGMTRTEISQLFGRHASATDIERALSLLEERSLASVEQEETGGRPVERWRAQTTLQAAAVVVASSPQQRLRQSGMNTPLLSDLSSHISLSSQSSDTQAFQVPRSDQQVTEDDEEAIWMG